MTDRGAEITDFLNRTGWSAARRAPLAGAASFRRYGRLDGGPAPALRRQARTATWRESV